VVRRLQAEGEIIEPGDLDADFTKLAPDEQHQDA
jgi:hypothetical protein